MMTDEQFKQEIHNRWGRYDRHRGHGRFWTGFFLLIIGGLLLLKVSGAIIFPFWFFSWPMFLIAFGVLSAFRHRFRGGFWAIMILVGGLFLFNDINHAWDLRKYIGPIALIAFGLLFITRPKKKHWRNWRNDQDQWNREQTQLAESSENDTAGANDTRDFLDITAVFGGIKKNVLSKSFKGGDIVSFMGGSEIDLTQADFTGKVHLDVTNVFGGTKLVVPPTWDIQNDMTAIFGGVDDKRSIAGVTMDPNKVLIIDGTCMFGGIEIRSY